MSQESILNQANAVTSDGNGSQPPNKSNNRRRNHRSKTKTTLTPKSQENPLNGSTTTTNTNHQPKKVLKKKFSAKLMEINKLLSKFKPITINGIPIQSLSKPYPEFLASITEDKSNHDDIYISFLIKPSDENFAYDLDFLKVSLCVPGGYPHKWNTLAANVKSSRQTQQTPNGPSISVLNDDIPRGYSINIEIGFRQIVKRALEVKLERKYKDKNIEHPKKEEDNGNGKRGKKKKVEEETLEKEEELETPIALVSGTSLFSMISTLDKYLESFLSREKKDTIKFVKRRSKPQSQPKSAEFEENNKEIPDNKKKSVIDITSVGIPNKILQFRNEEIARFKQRLSTDNARLFKETAVSSIYKLDLPFINETFTIEIENLENIVMPKLPVKLTIPKDYLFNSKRHLKLEIDMSNESNLKLMSSIDDKSLKLIFGKLISNMNTNFSVVALDFSKTNCEYINNKDDRSKEAGSYWTITSQLNFFIENIEKFLSSGPEFIKWFEARQLV